MKKFFLLLCPPIILKAYHAVKGTGKKRVRIPGERQDSPGQDLDIYWTKEMAETLETWGRGHAWIEIECLMVNCRGKVLDIACGTGVNIKDLSRYEFLDLYGFDISELLLKKAEEKGIDAARLLKCDATQTPYTDNEFQYSYSIGSLEHFTENGIDLFLAEAARYSAIGSFHQIPVSAYDEDEGWIKRGQSYYNNSVNWWLPKFKKHFSRVYVLPSGWKDEGVSVGKWFVCFK